MVFRALAIITLVSNVGALILQDKMDAKMPKEWRELVGGLSFLEDEKPKEPKSLLQTKVVHPTASPAEIEFYKTFMDKTPPISSIVPPKVKKGTGVPLHSGVRFVLESEVEPGLFIKTRKLGNLGMPAVTADLQHVKGGQLGLESGISAEAIFSFQNKDSSKIKSGDKVKWIQHNPSTGDERIDLLMALPKDNGGDKRSFQWPNPPVKKKMGKEGPDFLVEHARDVDRKWFDYKFGEVPMQEFFDDVLTDTRKGEEIKDGDSVFMRHHAPTGDGHGDWLFMTGDPAEGHHVAFPHHYPLFDGHIKNYEVKSWFNTNDPHSTSSRFTIRKLDFDCDCVNYAPGE